MTNQRKTISSFVALMLLTPSVALADGGGPLLLIFNFLAFLYGSVLIILVEWWVYCKFAGIPRKEAFWASLHVNIGSTLVVGFGFPFLLGVISVIGGFLPGNAGNISLAVGTWIFENIKYPKLTIAMTIFWLVVTFVLTVYYEKRLLTVRLVKREIESKIDLMKLSWYANGLTYTGLVLAFIVGWYFEIT
ncbi:hypothetical protein GURASL_28000 [Geotalea uraniireducens]|uniref:Uncharacterized protein n=1 Tax=Geotalea uraniireducens TaxID=351604 RepID=A0ABM8EN49_9BACT|nr:hypothetical protein [Geotalea uraniireducens]BDV43877.1 hypothetical protein GURASL_28000 [Geotalea uraniireducens]